MAGEVVIRQAVQRFFLLKGDHPAAHGRRWRLHPLHTDRRSDRVKG